VAQAVDNLLEAEQRHRPAWRNRRVETNVCVLDREDELVHESKTASTPETIAGQLAEAPSCRRIVFETGRMAPILFHGLSQLGPSRGLRREPPTLSGAQVACDSQERPQRRARAGVSGSHRLLQAHACEVFVRPRRPFADHRAQEAGWPARDLGKPDPWSCSRIRGPAASSAYAAFIKQALKASEGAAGLSVAMRGLIAARTAVMTAVAAIDADMRRLTRSSAACRRLMTIPGVGQLTALAFVAAIDDPSRIR
jgi:transposase